MEEEPTHGWRALQRPRRPTRAYGLPPFARLARTHALSVSGDTLLALALSGSLFFSIDPTDARWRVGLFLVLTMAPFSVVSPLIGPLMDRRAGGRRLMVVVAGFARAGICVLMVDDLDGLLLFPEAFAVLVLSKGYSVAKSALVPPLVQGDDALVEANSKLSLISGLVGFVTAVPAVGLLALGSAEWLLVVAVAMYAAAAISAFRIPRVAVAAEPLDDVERAELRSAGIVLGAAAMAILRGIVGFLLFLVAFWLRDVDAPEWWYGLILGASTVGSLVAAFTAPRLRRSQREEHILVAALVVVSVAAVPAITEGTMVWAALLALAVGYAAGAGKLAFDAIVQRDAPDANRGRSFAKFEARFQFAWVLGGFLPVVIPIPHQIGFAVMVGAAVFGGLAYVGGLRATRASRATPRATRIAARIVGPLDEPRLRGEGYAAGDGS